MKESSRRLFFALWPGPAERDGLLRATSDIVAAATGRVVPAQNLHVTLLFLGGVPESRLGDAYAIGSTVARSGVLPSGALPQLVFNAVEYWKKSRVMVATADVTQSRAVPAATLAGMLREAAARVGLMRDGNDLAPFRPHVTLVRDRAASGKSAGAPGKRSIDPVTWRFRDFVLVDSRTTAHGSIYTVLETFAFE